MIPLLPVSYATHLSSIPIIASTEAYIKKKHKLHTLLKRVLILISLLVCTCCLAGYAQTNTSSFNQSPNKNITVNPTIAGSANSASSTNSPVQNAVPCTTPPTITCPGNITPPTCGSQVVTYTLPAVQNNCATGTPLNLTQSTSTTITGGSVACGPTGSGTTNENSYYRLYDLAALGVSGPYTITTVAFGIELASVPSGSQPVNVRLYTLPASAAFNTGNLTLIASQVVTVANQSGTIISVPLTAPPTVAANARVVIEVNSPGINATAGAAFYIGSNGAGQTGTSYIRAPACGIGQPTSFANIGYPNVHIILNLEGVTSQLQQIAGLPSGATFPVGTTVNTFRVTDGSGNTATCSFNVVIGAPIAVSIASTNSPVCSGSNAVFNLSGTSGATVTYNLNGGANQTVTLTGGTATITVANATANQTLNLVSASNSTCSQAVSGSSTITINPLPTASITSNNSPICARNTATFTLSGTSGATVTYNINGSSNQMVMLTGGTASVNVPNATANQTLNLVSVTNGTCSQTLSGSSTVVVNPLPTASITSSNSPVCAGSTATFTITGTSGATVTYNINGGANQMVTLTSGTANISVTNATANQTLNLVFITNGTCSQSLSSSATVTVNPLPAKPTVMVSGPTIFNVGDSVTLTAPAGFASYLWSNGATTRSIVVYTAGSYSVVVTNSNGCSSPASDPVMVSLYASPVIFTTVPGAGNRSGLNWANAIGNNQIQSRMLSATAGSQFWVKTGIYQATEYPNGCANCNSDRDRAYLLRNGVGLYGGFAGTEFLLTQRNVAANTTTLSANGAYHVVLSTGNDTTARLDGFTITGGNANGYGERYVGGQTINQSTGAGIFVASASPRIANNIITANTASSSGAGMYNRSSSPLISYCTFSNNSSAYDGGGICNANASPTISYSTFTNNRAAGMGGGIASSNSAVNISNSSFAGNNSYSGGGIANYSSSATVLNTAFAGNSSTYGGGIYNIYSSNVAITNAVLASNMASQGGAIYNNACSPSIINSTLYTTNASGSWAFYNTNANPVITNSIIWSSGSAGIDNQNSAPVITYSIIKNGYAGTGNLNMDPLFVNAANPAGADGMLGTADDGLRVQMNSPAVNTGNNAAAAPGTDITGAPRIACGRVDMGAYENPTCMAVSAVTGGTDLTESINLVSKPANPENTNFSISVYPVPAKDVLWIKTNTTSQAGTNLQLMDASGKVLQTIPVTTGTRRIDISKLAKGMYWISAGKGKTVLFTKQ